MKEVVKMDLGDGRIYTGATESDGYMDVPHGMGICKYKDHSESGMYKDGELNGIAYLNYHEWMYVGTAKNGKINGWGLKAERGKFSFGVYMDGELVVNLTPLVEIFWTQILEDANTYGINAVSVKKSGYILVGVPQHGIKGRFGFHFLQNGEVFLGICDYGQTNLTGMFLHFDKDYNITRGVYKDGVYVGDIDDAEFVSACGVWSNYEYVDFDINMNYHPKSFMFGKKKLLYIFEMGHTEQNLIVKANVCTIIGNQYECKSGDCESTIWFKFPLYDEIEEELQEIMNNESHAWVPNFSDYQLEFINNFSNTNSKHQPIYKHISCWNDDYYQIDFYDDTAPEELGFDTEEDERHILYRLIPDFEIKKELLTKQWAQHGWYMSYPSLRDYVSSLALDDDVENFFSWLFNDHQLNNCSVWDLSHDDVIAWEQFQKLFPDSEE